MASASTKVTAGTSIVGVPSGAVSPFNPLPPALSANRSVPLEDETAEWWTVTRSSNPLIAMFRRA